MLQFTKEEVEGALAVALPHGCRRKVAQISGLGESYIKRQFNENDETPSCAFKLLQIVCALDDHNAELGDEFWETMSRFRDLSKKRRVKRAIDLNHRSGKFNREVAEFMMAKLENEPIETQLSELDDAQRELDELKKDLIEEYHRQSDHQPLLRRVR